MNTEITFEYTCPECEHGKVRTTRVQNYKTKIKGYPFVVDEATIGVCDQCRAESFAPEETKRWENLFSRSLEAQQAFLSPKEISELRKALGLSMEDFARLIGSTRQSVSMWEREDRPSPPLRIADLLMKLVRQSLRAGPVDVPTFLLDEARKWGVVIELRRPAERSDDNGKVVLLAKKKPKHSPLQASDVEALAADTAEEEEQIIAETMDGRPVGILNYDYEQAALILHVTGSFPAWATVDAEITSRNGQRFHKLGIPREEQLVILNKSSLQTEDIVQITLKPHQEKAME